LIVLNLCLQLSFVPPSLSIPTLINKLPRLVQGSLYISLIIWIDVLLRLHIQKVGLCSCAVLPIIVLSVKLVVFVLLLVLVLFGVEFDWTN
jgi:hypothetical protein